MNRDLQGARPGSSPSARKRPVFVIYPVPSSVEPHEPRDRPGRPPGRPGSEGGRGPLEGGLRGGRPVLTGAIMSPGRQAVTVERLLREEGAELRLELAAGGASIKTREVTDPKDQKPGHALTGFMEMVRPGCLQVFGRSELSYLNTLDDKARAAIGDKIAQLVVPCLVITNGLPVPEELRAACETHALPLLTTSHS